jgi:hypothetical protein
MPTLRNDDDIGFKGDLGSLEGMKEEETTFNHSLNSSVAHRANPIDDTAPELSAL